MLLAMDLPREVPMPKNIPLATLQQPDSPLRPLIEAALQKTTSPRCSVCNPPRCPGRP